MDLIQMHGGDPKITSSDLAFGSNVFDVLAPNDVYMVSVNCPDCRVSCGSWCWSSSVYNGGSGLTIYAKLGWRLHLAIEEVRVSLPVLVEWMLLDRVQPIRYMWHNFLSNIQLPFPF